MKELVGHNINANSTSQNKFVTNQIQMLSNQIEFVRNRFVYDRVEYNDIKKVELGKGYLIKNRWIIRLTAIVAIFLLIQFIQYSMKVTKNYEDTNLSFWFNKGSIISVWGPFLLIICLFIAVYQSFLSSTVISIETPKYKRSISIRKLDKSGETELLIPFLRTKGVKVVDNR